jgi:ATP synthase protein I
MNADDKSKSPKNQVTFSHEIETKVKRKLKARRNPNSDTWIGLGKLGLVGWSIVVPTLLGAALGIWIDKHYLDEHSWTLMLMLFGLIIGCISVWHWIIKEHKEMHDDKDDKHE